MNLKQLRASKKMTQEQLSEASGVAQGFISDIERGKKKPTITIIDKLAKGLGITVSELVDGKSA